MRARAFTLFEMLVAVAITVIITATLAATVGVGFRVRDAAERAVGVTRDTAVIGQVFARDLGDCLPPASAASDPTNATSWYTAGPFYGTSTDLQFYASGPEPKAIIQADSRLIEYTIEQDTSGSGLALVRKVDTNVLADTGASLPTTEVLIKDVVSLQLRYYDGATWYDSWDSTQNGNSLPYAVALRLELAPSIKDGPNRVIERYVPLWCAVPPSQSTTGGF